MASDHVMLLTSSVSPFGMRVHIALNMKGVQFECQEEDLQNKSQLLLTSNPIHKTIPVLIHNGKAVCESLIIVEYIDEVWSSEGKSFLPDDPFQRAVARFWADYIEKKFCEAAVRIVLNPPGEVQEKAKNDLKEAYVTLDCALRDVACGKPYFGGDCIGLVDIAFGAFIGWFKVLEELGKFELPDEKECAHLWAWKVKMGQCPSVKEVLAMAPPEKIIAHVTALRERLWGV